MTSKISRREVFKASLGTAFVSLLPFESSSLGIFGESNNNILELSHTSLVKHGHPKANDKFLWSVMKVPDASRFNDFIEVVLMNNNYSSIIRYKSNDKFKMAACKEIVDSIYKSEFDINFTMTFFKGNVNNFKELSPANLTSKMNSLFENSLSGVEIENLISKSEDRFGPSDRYKENFTSNFNTDLITIDAKKNRLIQVNDLISGICYSILNQHIIGSRVKNELNDYFDNYFRLSEQRDNENIDLNRIKIRQIMI